MSLVCFGQPESGIIQTAYVVEDVQQAIREWITKLKVGPWFLLEHFTSEDALYWGRPTDVDVSIAMSFAGHMMIERIEQHNDLPSVYRDITKKRRYGFHHWGVATADFDRDVERIPRMGMRSRVLRARAKRRPRGLHGYDFLPPRHDGVD